MFSRRTLSKVTVKKLSICRQHQNSHTVARNMHRSRQPFFSYRYSERSGMIQARVYNIWNIPEYSIFHFSKTIEECFYSQILKLPKYIYRNRARRPNPGSYKSPYFSRFLFLAKIVIHALKQPVPTYLTPKITLGVWTRQNNVDLKQGDNFKCASTERNIQLWPPKVWQCNESSVLFHHRIVTSIILTLALWELLLNSFFQKLWITHRVFVLILSLWELKACLMNSLPIR